ncbi:MAG: hypothetical protein ABIN80_05310 [Dyadobacter sp.]|uniref:hypothetical protein n=1 Tax=Dyadobacter sp. TaxID=1914288 RepID=UPI00326383ED
MKTSRLLVSILLLITATEYVHSQNNTNHFEIEVDPIAYIFKGYSGHFGYQLGKVRLDAGAFNIDQPAFFINNDKFKNRSYGYGLKADYIFKKRKGFFVGLQTDYTKDRLTLKNTGREKTTQGLFFGVRGGYRFMLGAKERDYRGLYIAPWVALTYSANAKHVIIDEQVFRQARYGIFPTVHIGYSF